MLTEFLIVLSKFKLPLDEIMRIGKWSESESLLQKTICCLGLFYPTLFQSLRSLVFLKCLMKMNL